MQGGVEFHFWSLWYDATWDWTQVSRTIDEHCVCVYIYYLTYIAQLAGVVNHHHHVVPLARISLTISRHFSLSFIAFGRSSGLHPVSSHSCCMYVRASRPAFAWPYVGVHRSTSLMSSSLLLQQCPACLFRLTWIVFVMGARWPYSWCLVGCCLQDLFNIAHKILVKLPSSFFSNRLVSVRVVHPYSSIDTTAAWKKLQTWPIKFKLMIDVKLLLLHNNTWNHLSLFEQMINS